MFRSDKIAPFSFVIPAPFHLWWVPFIRWKKCPISTSDNSDIFVTTCSFTFLLSILNGGYVPLFPFTAKCALILKQLRANFSSITHKGSPATLAHILCYYEFIMKIFFHLYKTIFRTATPHILKCLLTRFAHLQINVQTITSDCKVPSLSSILNHVKKKNESIPDNVIRM